MLVQPRITSVMRENVPESGREAPQHKGANPVGVAGKSAVSKHAAWRRALMATSALAFLLLAGSPTAQAQVNQDIEDTPFVLTDVNQVNTTFEANININDAIANIQLPVNETNIASTLLFPSLTGIESFDAQSIAIADMQVLGTAGGAVIVNQVNATDAVDNFENPFHQNVNQLAISATAVALTQPISIINDPAGPTFALSDATASAGFDVELTQSNSNVFEDTNDTDQDVLQSNFAEHDFFATAVAVSGDVSITSTGPVNAPGNGLQAVSQARTLTGAHIGNTITQSNNNDLTSTDDADLDQDQDLAQSNEIDKLMVATDVSVAGDASISSTDPVTAVGHGLTAESRATSLAEIHSTVTQSNTNTMAGTTTSTNDDLVQVQGDDDPWEQENDNFEVAVATAVSVTGNATVNNQGDIDAGLNGLNAVTSADADASIDNDVTQSNSNSLTGTVQANGSNIDQLQGDDEGFEQENENTEIGIATAVSVAGGANVNSEGKITADDNGINAGSDAVANAAIDSSVNQTNSNTLTATGTNDPVSQVQGGASEFEQENENTELYVATAVAVAGDTNITTNGDIKAGEHGINAETNADANAEIGSGNTVNQTNTNSVTGTTTGTTANLFQNQDDFEQENENEQLYAATAIAVVGDTVVTDDGDTRAELNGINAVSNANASATNASIVTQNNTNQVTGTATGDGSGVFQSQGETEWEQDNENVGLRFATGVAVTGDVIVNKAGKIDAGGNGINATTNANATASNASSVSQSNANTLSGTTEGDPDGTNVAFVTQNQGVGEGAEWEQENLSAQLSLATAIAVTGDVTVSNNGKIDAGANGITALSAASATSNNSSNVTQANSNAATATTSGIGGFIAQGDVAIDLDLGFITIDLVDLDAGQNIEQTNINLGLTAATSIASAGDINVSDSGYIDAAGDGINAQSDAFADARAESGVGQSNGNSFSGETTGEPATVIGTPVLPAFINQSQDVEQANVNAEAVIALSLADSGDVSVTRDGDTHAGGFGINAVSNAVATSTVVSSVSQSNTNSASATTQGDGAFIAQSDLELDLLGIVEIEIDGGQAVTQGNINAQLLAAGAGASSGDVTVVNTGDMAAGADGINAISNASASATVDSGTSVNQSNTNSMTGTTEGDLALVLQDQEVTQFNVNAQLLAAAAGAQSGNVSVTSSGDSKAGGTGINAISSATATADLDNTVTQSNFNDLDGTGAGSVTQDQEVLQINANLQGGAAIATALSGSVDVDQYGTLHAKGDGIVAISEANADAHLAQSVGQSNDNAANATLRPGEIDLGEDLEFAGALGLQTQFAVQLNVNEQEAASIATAISGPVTVYSEQDPADGNGILAISGASSNAAVTQNADQSNVNSASITLPPLPIVPVNGEQQPDPSVEIAAQLEGVIQANVNDQDGLAVATSIAGPVLVDQGGTLVVGLSGIVADSNAQSAANVEQSATQSNLDSKLIDRAVGPEPGPDETTVQPVTVAAQLEGVLQINASEQEGVAVATSIAGPVDVFKDGKLTAGGSGIDAFSGAVATANVNQAVEQGNDVPEPGQSNENSVEAEGALVLQGQLAGQFNINEQDALSIATSVSGPVTVDHDGQLSAGGTGITAISSAFSSAGVDQTVNQSNSNSANALLTPTEVEIDLDDVDLDVAAAIGIQLQGALQLNASEQEGVAVATSLAGSAHVDKDGKLDATGDGITATSVAGANAGVNQSATQSNVNSANADGGLALQGQLLGQVNVNTQQGASIATALSDSVTVHQDGNLKAGGDGISAISSAGANAGVAQTADQSNANSATATLAPAEIVIQPIEDPDIEFEVVAGIQAQGLLQLNANEQEAASIATALSGPVEVTSEQDPSGGTGIEAISSATSNAGVIQDAGQSNVNSANITLPLAGEVEVTEEGTPPDQITIVTVPDPRLEIAAQLEAVAQVNLNEQNGVAIATSVSDSVSVDQEGNLKAGGEGITAVSNATSGAGVSQTATQSNSDSKVIDRALNGEGDLAVQPLTVSAQLEGVLQINASEQTGVAVATSLAGPVTVDKEDKLDVGGNGITAISSATATSGIQQTAIQGNEIDVDAEGTAVIQGQLAGQFNINQQSAASVANAVSDYVEIEQDGNIKAGGDGITATSNAVASAGVSQSADQGNGMNANALLTPAEEVEAVVISPPPPFIVTDSSGVLGLQLQLAGQVNVNEQEAASIANALSGYVVVDSEQDPSGGDGITATSSAVATAGVSQSAVQNNANSANMTLPLAPEIQLDDAFINVPGTNVEITAQLEGVVQANINDQDAVAIANAESDYVSVEQRGTLTAGGDGINATSAAVATAGIGQSAEQSNADAKSIARLEDPSDGVDVEPATIAAQLEGLLQLNVSDQDGLVVANATAGPVDVDSKAKIEAGGDGITAASTAVATAGLSQTVTQTNTNSVDAEGTLVLQGQLLGQLNLNSQEGAVFANAFADAVEVDQNGGIKAGGNGITAASSAVATAGLTQSATQSNANSANALLTPATESAAVLSDPPAPPVVFTEPSSVLGLQLQLAGQINASEQDGVADADAISGPVEVRSTEDPSGQDGITATSSAVATAGLNQSVEQSNVNSANIALPALEGSLFFVQDEDVEIALQLEGVLQANVSVQAGEARATSFADEVEVDQKGLLDSGGDGVNATSLAVATAVLKQEATQLNDDAKGITRILPTEAEDIPLPETFVAQVQAALQANVNLQFGEADADAVSGPVDVETDGNLDAGGDGINAASSAVATAVLNQTATQSNTSSVAAEFDAGPDTTLFQLQLLAQANVNVQQGAAIATAFADEVEVNQGGNLHAGGNGITATSSAVATAVLNQATDQSNSNEGIATVVVLDEPLVPLVTAVPQALIQGNINVQSGGVFAEAVSSDVEVESAQDPSAGDGVTATSSAVATAGLDQNATQTNDNSTEVLVDGGLVLVEDDQPIIVQGNLSLQEGEAVALASSADVNVDKSGTLEAGGDGLAATSGAVAVAGLEQSIDQTNANAQNATIESGDVVQDQGAVIQANVNGIDVEFGEVDIYVPGQQGFALAAAESGEVEVGNTGKINAGGDGLNATSQAVAVAGIDQTANQANANSQNALVELAPIEVLPAGTVVQNQFLVVQANSNVQEGVAIAAATSDEVEVWNKGNINADGDGIHAESTAVAVSGVVQNATQSNANSQTGTDPNQVLQSQDNVIQLNDSEQDAVAVSLASSDDVDVYSEGNIDPEDGIDASSNAVAVAAVEQNLTQTNSNSQNASVGPDNVRVAITQDDIFQINNSDQYGTAVSVAVAGEVNVESKGKVGASEHGIDAASTAVAVATVDQSVSQANENTVNVFSGDEGVVIPPPDNFQLNIAEQEGIAVAVALSDTVDVDQTGNVKAGMDGIRGVSLASASANVTQEATQENTSPVGENLLDQFASTVAVAVAEEVSIRADGSITAGQDGIVGVSAATASAIGGSAPLELVGLQYGDYEVGDYQPGDWAALSFDPDAFAFAQADEVHIDFKGSIVAKDNGIVAISVAKASAEGNPADGDAAAVAISNDVNVTVRGDITAGKTGIFAASIADANADGGLGFEYEEQGNVTVAVKKGTVTGGNGYYGIAVLGGDDNLITIGKGGAVTSLSKHAIFGGDQDETVKNAGLVDGDVDLGLGNNTFINQASGSFYTWNIINLNGGELLNAGLLSPGGPGVIKTTSLDGSLDQTKSGAYAVDIDLGNKTADRINATGTARWNGKVLPDVIANPVSGKTDVTIASAAGGTTNNGLSVKDTAVADYSVLFPNATDVVLRTDVDFAAKGLSKDQNGLGQHLNNVFKKGGPDSMDQLGLALLRLPNLSDLQNAYQQLDGENYRALSMSTLYASEQFSTDMMSCPTLEGGAYSIIAEDQCVWARVRFRNLEYDANSGTTGFDEDAVAISGGGQVALSGPWFAGLALGYENSEIDIDKVQMNSDGDRFHLGGSLKYIDGPWLFAGAISGGNSWYDTHRSISFPGFSSSARSEQDIFDIGGQFRAAYLISSGTWYAKPLVDLNLTYIDMDGFTERGGSGAALRFAGGDETVFSATPALEIGTQARVTEVIIARPYVRGGVSFYTDGDFPLRAGFAAAPGAGSFTTTGEIDDVVGNISTGVVLLGMGTSTIAVNYDGSFGDNLEEHSVQAKASVKW